LIICWRFVGGIGVHCLVCDPGRCLTPEFRFLGDRLRTRFR